MMEIMPVESQHIDKEKELAQKIHKLGRHEEKYWWLKSQILWLRSGEKKNPFFHK